MNAYDFSLRTIDGADLPLDAFRGQAVLLVNTASACGLTPQYDGLEQLYKTYGARGLVVLGVPSNDFGGQEPGSEAEIKTFCETRFAVDFPLASKEKVSGEGAHPLYRAIVAEAGEAAAPKWNFHKYLIGRDGTLRASFGSRTAPEAPEIVAAIEAELG
ncbi:glutathione peroxidase [Methylocella sp.]|uniref:glutathione peroxidase n=1 Tax=Methylocella sp. TaxID=1978226 RepID=UPI003782D44C